MILIKIYRYCKTSLDDGWTEQNMAVPWSDTDAALNGVLGNERLFFPMLDLCCTITEFM